MGKETVKIKKDSFIEALTVLTMIKQYHFREMGKVFGGKQLPDGLFKYLNNAHSVLLAEGTMMSGKPPSIKMMGFQG